MLPTPQEIKINLTKRTSIMDADKKQYRRKLSHANVLLLKVINNDCNQNRSYPISWVLNHHCHLPFVDSIIKFHEKLPSDVFDLPAVMS